ncbi:helix-turn-helix domain-containing protein [Chryseobacterium sp. X308]|uniref:helix-turn-helix domain-containing protein n=1 Tax=unclassified Chryseobacterium TaxID=2593645 RepID=UPI001D141F2C|nr:helix-turn-helix domain-containing protein [Chryseobacterium sp. X308]MCC3215656.1 helix-turn-helix domain-containing protein [Chryseobacterium sp. X308]
MKYYPIPEALMNYVESIWSFESPEQMEADEQAAIIPSGRWIVIWNYSGKYEHIIQNQSYHHSTFDLHLVGQHHTKIVLKGNVPVHSIGISFKPYGYYSIAGSDLSNYLSKVVSISKRKLDGSEVLTDFSGNLQESVTQLTELLTERIRFEPDSRVVHIAEQINAHKGNILIKDLFAGINTSQRHLNKLFKLQTGITPKEYASIVRFQEIFNRYIRNKKPENKNELYDLFYDESHFLQSFRKVLTLQPNVFLKKNNKLGNEFIKK